MSWGIKKKTQRCVRSLSIIDCDQIQNPT